METIASLWETVPATSTLGVRSEVFCCAWVNMQFFLRNSRCVGGHGLSIGSLGKNGEFAQVENVLYVPFYTETCYQCLTNCRIENVTVVPILFFNATQDLKEEQEKSSYAARFKSWKGGNGLVKKYVGKGLKLSMLKIRQCHLEKYRI